MIFSINKLIDSRFFINGHINSGGMAEIYEAYDKYTRKSVAIKVIKKEFQDDDFEVERFQNEARYTSMFSHPHIIKIYNIGEHEGNFFISYELMTGCTLKSYLDKRSFLSLKEAIDAVLQVLDATKHIHERGVIHNDIKPENLFLFSDGNIKLIDFGIATHIDDDIPEKVNASVVYAAPEVLRDKQYSVQSDIYSIGTIFFELLCGKTPYLKANSKEEMHAHLYENVPSISKYMNLENVEGIDYIVMKATNRDLKKRYQNDQEMINDLISLKTTGKIKKKNIIERILRK